MMSVAEEGQRLLVPKLDAHNAQIAEVRGVQSQMSERLREQASQILGWHGCGDADDSNLTPPHLVECYRPITEPAPEVAWCVIPRPSVSRRLKR